MTSWHLRDGLGGRDGARRAGRDIIPFPERSHGRHTVANGQGPCSPASAFRVYTQNVYLGGDTRPLLTIDNLDDIPTVLDAAGRFWAEVVASDIPARARVFVDEIDRQRPHVVALQEVLRFMLLGRRLQPVGGIDILTEIRAEIERRGLPYEVAMVQDATSSTLPLVADATNGGISTWLQFTDRLVVLKRKDVRILRRAQGQYEARASLGPIELVRGWARLTVEHDGVPHHLIATHLEVQAIMAVHMAQAAELQNSVAARLDGITIIAGDLNSDAAAAPGTPSWTPTYDNLVSAGFTDVWAAATFSDHEEGVTCCHDPSLGAGRVLDERIDFVMVRREEAKGLDRSLLTAEVVGVDPSDRTRSGLWPSDHAGLVATLLVPREQHDSGEPRLYLTP